jgi:transcriptional regulator with XRE-family HTH domain
VLGYAVRMSPAEELLVLRRRLRLTQQQFADCVGMSKDLVKSIESGRRRLTEHWEREIARVFEGVHFGVQTSAPMRAPLQQRGKSVSKSPTAPHIFGCENRPENGVRSELAQPVPAVPPAPATAGPRIEFYCCEVLGCAYETPGDMRYCAQHMALAMIEGRPTRRDIPSMTGPLHADFVR